MVGSPLYTPPQDRLAKLGWKVKQGKENPQDTPHSEYCTMRLVVRTKSGTAQVYESMWLKLLLAIVR